MGKGHFRLVPYRLLPRIDWWLILITLALMGFGIITLWGATSSGEGPGPLTGYARRQCIFAGVGLAVMVGMVLFDYRRLRLLAWPLYALLLVALGGLLLKGEAIKGARSWYELPGFNLQPTEPGKIIMIIVLAAYLAMRIQKFRGLRHTVVPLIIAGVPLLLILAQPDLGSAAVLIPMIAVLFWVSGLRKWVFMLFTAVGIMAAVAGYQHLKPYQQARLLTFVNPEADRRGSGWNIIQAQTTLGSGQMFGKGWGMGTQTAMQFLPEFHTDFIFPTVGEQFGMVGCVVLLGLFFLLIARMVRLAMMTNDVFGILLITGMATILGTHVFFNIGMCVGLLPVTGLPLPFFSYGGSFLLTCFAMIGITLSVGARRGL